VQEVNAPTAGELLLNRKNGKLFAHDGACWVAIHGPEGAKGDQGESGRSVVKVYEECGHLVTQFSDGKTSKLWLGHVCLGGNARCQSIMAAEREHKKCQKSQKSYKYC
jgi:hypothetical protein